MLRRHISDSPQHQWMACPLWPGLRWWTEPVLNSMSVVIEARGRQGLRRGLVIFSLCSGAGAEAWTCSAIGLPVDQLWACDTDAAARKFMMAYHKPRLTHLYHSMAAFRRGSVAGDCDVQGGYCVEQNTPTPDLLIGGPPCPPYSGFRHNRAAVPPELHPDFDTIFGVGPGSYLYIVEQYRPRGGRMLESTALYVKSSYIHILQIKLRPASRTSQQLI